MAAPMTLVASGSTSSALTTGARPTPVAPRTPISLVRLAIVRVEQIATSTTPTSRTTTAINRIARCSSFPLPSACACALTAPESAITSTTRNAPVAVVTIGSTIVRARRLVESRP